MTEDSRLKEIPKPNDPVCYCFGYTRRDIESDYHQNKHSTILDRIISEKRSGGCNCANTNPKGG